MNRWPITKQDESIALPQAVLEWASKNLTCTFELWKQARRQGFKRDAARSARIIIKNYTRAMGR